MSTSLKVAIILGSVRHGPPKPSRVGVRVAKAVKRRLEEHLGGAGSEVVVIDPLEIRRAMVEETLAKHGGSDREGLAALVADAAVGFQPHFAYGGGDCPAVLETTAREIESSDAYIIVSPEYNHSIAPAAADLLNHFGSSLFSFKSSLIVSYSAGQWGGARAAMGWRQYLTELGALPVSATVLVPAAQDVYNEEGLPRDGQAAWDTYIDRGVHQLLWWCEAAKRQRATAGPATAAFTRTPRERNAPSRP